MSKKTPSECKGRLVLPVMEAVRFSLVKGSARCWSVGIHLTVTPDCVATNVWNIVLRIKLAGNDDDLRLRTW